MENQNVQVQEEQALTLNDLFFILKRNLILILCVTLLITGIGAVYGFCFKSYTYQANATIMVKADSQSVSAAIYNDTTQALRMVVTITEFIENDLVLTKTAEKLAATEQEVKSIKNMLKNGISIKNTEDSLIINMSMKSSVEKLYEAEEDIFVVEALNTLIETAQEVSKTPLLDSEGKPTVDDKGNPKYKYAFIADNIQDLSLPDNTQYTASRGASLVIIICFIAGLVIGYLIALLRHIFDDTFKTKDDLENMTGFPILACIEDIPVSSVQAQGGKK